MTIKKPIETTPSVQETQFTTLLNEVALRPVLVRTYSAGVHFGYLMQRMGKEVVLLRSRRIWKWAGAYTLSEIATNGVDIANSKIAAPVTITLTEAIEIIECTPAAEANLNSAVWSP